MSIFTSWLERGRDWLMAPLLGMGWVDHRKDILERRSYARGRHRQLFKDKSENIVINFVGLIVSRGISMLFGKGVEFDLPGEDETDEKKYIDAIWKANKKGQFLLKIARYGGESGTWYAKIIPDGVVGVDGVVYPRLVAQDPAFITMETLPEDNEQVILYTISYNLIDPITKKDIVKKQEIRHDVKSGDGEDAIIDQWSIKDFEADSGGKWKLVNEQVWPHSFPPIQHGENMPLPGEPYGEPDLTDDIIELQDRFNFVVSNVGKIIKFHAHPKTWGRMFGGKTKQFWGADEMVISNVPEAHLENLEMESDLISSMTFIEFIRQALFDVSRNVDINSFGDKLGALTNFALHVLYQDASDKIETKRLLYGDALVELNEKMLRMAGKDPDAGVCKWPKLLPMDAREQAEGLTLDSDAGRVSKQTAITEQGRDWEVEQERIEGEKSAAGNIGENIINSFNRTGG